LKSGLIVPQKPVIAPRDSQALRDLVSATSPSKIVEFGSWQGRSALTFLTEATRTNPKVAITCVDTWLGSPEHWGSGDAGGEWAFENLGLEAGEPTFIEDFRQAIKSFGFEANVRILRAPTAFSERYLLENFNHPDLFYIDADHSTRAVANDLKIALKVSPSGLISGDDWCWPSVQRAVLPFAIRNGAKILVAPDDFGWALEFRHNGPASSLLRSRGWKTKHPIAIAVFLTAHLVGKPLRSWRAN
jgi:predicted O-methyltransferase YrrM